MTKENVEASVQALSKNTLDIISGIVIASQNCCAPAINSLNESENEYLFKEARKLVDEVEGITKTVLKEYRKVLIATLDTPEVEDYRTSLIEQYNALAFQVQETTKLERCLVERSPKAKMTIAIDLTVKLQKILAKSNLSTLHPL